jgi:hypothetical protein
MVNAFRRLVGCTLEVEIADVPDRRFVIPELGNYTEVQEVPGPTP